MIQQVIRLSVLLLAGGAVSAAQLAPHTVTFTLANTGGGVTDARLRIAFDTLPAAGEDYFIDHVSLKCGGAEILVNGDFSGGQGPWKFFSNAVPKATADFASGEAVISFGPDGNNQQLYQKDLVLPASPAECTLSFDACSTGGPDDPGFGHNVSVFLHKHTGPFVNYGLSVSGAPPSPAPEVDLISCSAGPFCGDGIVDAGEDCDDGGESEFCDADCTPADCGDGTVNAAAGEECDPGTMKGAAPSCTAGCLIPDGDCATAACSLFWLSGAQPVPDFCAPRFVDNNDGTVTDRATDLVWLKNADCFGQTNYDEATQAAAGLADGQCGLTDGSAPGDWRLPTLMCPQGTSCDLATATGELSTLFAPSCPAPAILDAAGTGCWMAGDDAFTGIQSDEYWSSSVPSPGFAWLVYLDSSQVGREETAPDQGRNQVWPVRVRP